MLIAARVIQAHISHNHVRPGDLRDLIRNVHAALTGLSISDAVETAEPAAKATAAQIKRSIMPDGLVSFEDGKSYKFQVVQVTAAAPDSTWSDTPSVPGKVGPSSRLPDGCARICR